MLKFDYIKPGLNKSQLLLVKISVFYNLTEQVALLTH